MNKIFKMVIWTGKAATFFVGLAVALSVALAIAAGAAEAAKTRSSLKAGVNNAVKATTSMVGSVAGPILKLDNNGSGPALDLQVEPGNAPMTVNPESGTATNLSADELDGLDSTDFQPSDPCPDGTLFHEGVCIEKIGRDDATFRVAEDTCLAEGKRLPTVAELQTFRNREGQDMNGFSDWTSHVFLSGAESRVVVMGINISGRQPTPFNPNTNNQFRCVEAPN